MSDAELTGTAVSVAVDMVTDMADEELTELLNRVAADAEAAQGLPDDGGPLPEHVRTSRPNRPPRE